MNERLRNLCPWPETKPDVPLSGHGWLTDGTKELLAPLLPHARLIVELGSWVGLSARWMLDHASDADLIAVDHWNGFASADVPSISEDAEAQRLMPILFETFVANCWEYRDRLFPLRGETYYGLHRIFEAGCKPDLIYIDADHNRDAVSRDIATAWGLFPGAVIVGDDWTWVAVREAVILFGARVGARVETRGNAWRLHRETLA